MPYQIKNGIVYGSGAVSLTQAQYDALSTAEKNNGTVYYIYDSDAVMDAEDVGIDGGGTLQDLAGSIATIETSPATAAHAVGSYILWNGQLYEVTSAIAVGETLTVGSNITATTLTTGLIHFDLLWENPNPTASFSAQTISLDLSTYDFVMVSGSVPDYSGQCFYSFCEIGKTTELFAMTNSRHLRTMTVTGTGVNFGQGSKAGSPSQDVSQNNATMIPQKIWGIRF